MNRLLFKKQLLERELERTNKDLAIKFFWDHRDDIRKKLMMFQNQYPQEFNDLIHFWVKTRKFLDDALRTSLVTQSRRHFDQGLIQTLDSFHELNTDLSRFPMWNALSESFLQALTNQMGQF